MKKLIVGILMSLVGAFYAQNSFAQSNDPGQDHLGVPKIVSAIPVNPFIEGLAVLAYSGKDRNLSKTELTNLMIQRADAVCRYFKHKNSIPSTIETLRRAHQLVLVADGGKFVAVPGAAIDTTLIGVTSIVVFDKISCVPL